MIELTFPKEFILIKQVHQKTAIFVYWHFLDKGFKFQYIDDVMNLSDIAILNNIGVEVVKVKL